MKDPEKKTYGVYAHDGIGLDNGKATRHYSSFVSKHAPN